MAGKFITKVRNKALFPNFFTKSTLNVLLLLLALCTSERSALASLRLELVGSYPSITGIKSTGNINDLPVLSSSPIGISGIFFATPRPGSGNSFQAIQINVHFGTVNKRYSFTQYIDNPTCPTNLQGWQNYANSILGSLYLPVSGSYDEAGNTFVSLLFSCTYVSNGNVYNMDLLALTPGYDIEVINPPAPNSVCSLNSQNMSLDFNSTSLNVNGLSQTQNLNVSCTTGTAKDYSLRLTGSNVTSGRLDFGNGVSAQIYLNGTAVSANAPGPGISLNGLTSRTVTVRGELVGTASGAGVTNAYGVLILEAL